MVWLGPLLLLARRYLYILDNALTTYTAGEGDGKPPVPPCILKIGADKTQVGGRALTRLVLQSVHIAAVCVLACCLARDTVDHRLCLLLRPAPHATALKHRSNTAPAPATPWNCQVALEVDDRGKQRLILRVTADFVRVQASAGRGWGSWLSAGVGMQARLQVSCRRWRWGPLITFCRA